MTTAEAEAPKVCRMAKPAPEIVEDNDRETAEVSEAPKQKPYRRVAICGTSETTAHLAPVLDKNPDGSNAWEVWTLGNGYKRHGRNDLHFQLHDLEDGAKRWSAEYKTWLASSPCPILLQKLRPDWIPSGVEYPLAQIMQRFPNGSYQTCMIAQMIALALLMDVDEIGIYGCDLASDAEYAYQRPSVEYWLGIAQGMGKKVHIPRESDLLKTREIYGFQTHGGVAQNDMSRCFYARKQELESRIRQHQAQLENHKRALFVLQGALENMDYTAHWLGLHTNNTGYDAVMKETAIQESDGHAGS